MSASTTHVLLSQVKTRSCFGVIIYCSYLNLWLLSRAWDSCAEVVRSVVIETRLGKVEGTTLTARNGRTFNAYYAIPYAKTPIGKLRFQVIWKLSTLFNQAWRLGWPLFWNWSDKPPGYFSYDLKVLLPNFRIFYVRNLKFKMGFEYGFFRNLFLVQKRLTITTERIVINVS